MDIGRALAALLVFYSHLAEPWIDRLHENAPYVDVIEALTSDPMLMSHQGIGQIAVPFFFLVSGFVVTPIAMRQGPGRFAINRTIRVYAPLLFTVLLTAVLMLLKLGVPSTGQNQTLSPLNVLTNATLANYLMLPQVILVPVAWTLIIEALFYVLLTLLLPVLRRSVWLAIAIELTLVFVILTSAREFGSIWFLIAINVSYLPILLIGQAIWATTNGKIPLWLGGIYVGAAWSLYVLADRMQMGRIDNSYNLALAFAVICFLMGMFAEPKLKERPFWVAVSERSYSIYLLHMLVSFVILDAMRPQVPLPIALVAAIVGVFAVVEVSYRLVERPSHGLARKLSRRKPPEKAPVAVEPKPEPKPKPEPRRERGTPEELANEVTREIARLSEPAPPPRRRPPPPPLPPRPQVRREQQPQQPVRRPAPRQRPVPPAEETTQLPPIRPGRARHRA